MKVLSVLLFIFSTFTFSQTAPKAEKKAAPVNPAPALGVESGNQNTPAPSMDVGSVSKKEVYTFVMGGVNTRNFLDISDITINNSTEVNITGDTTYIPWVGVRRNIMGKFDLTAKAGTGYISLNFDFDGMNFYYENESIDAKATVKQGGGTLNKPAGVDFDDLEWERTKIGVDWHLHSDTYFGLFYETRENPFVLTRRDASSESHHLDNAVKTNKKGLVVYWDSYRKVIEDVFSSDSKSVSRFAGNAYFEFSHSTAEFGDDFKTTYNPNERKLNAFIYKLNLQVNYVYAKWMPSGRLYGFTVGYNVGSEQSFHDGDTSDDVAVGDFFWYDTPQFLTHGLTSTFTVSF